MKKISNYQELMAETARLKERRLFLEARMASQWTGLKEQLQPSSAAKVLVDTMFRRPPQTVKGTLLRSALAFGVGLLVEKAGPGWLQALRRKKKQEVHV